MCLWVGMCICMWRPQESIGTFWVLFWHCLLYSPETGSLTEPGAQGLLCLLVGLFVWLCFARMAVQQANLSSYLCLLCIFSMGNGEPCPGRHECADSVLTL